MEIKKFSSEAEWLAFRRGKVTGSRLANIQMKRNGKSYADRKAGFWELLAEKMTDGAIAALEADSRPMDRGHELEPVALVRFTEMTGKELDSEKQMWISSEDDRMAVSPDATVVGENEAVEVKSLSAAKHAMAIYLNKYPDDDYEEQACQYFIVNPKLERLHFVLFNPAFIKDDLKIFTIERSQVAEKIEQLAKDEVEVLDEVERFVGEWLKSDF